MKDNNYDKTVYMDRECYERILKKVELESIELDEIRRSKGNCKHVGTYENWDSTDLLETLKAQNVVENMININKAIIDNAVIIERKYEEDIVELGDVIRINIIEDNEVEELIIKLVGAPEYNYSTDRIYQEEISYATPIGKAIYGKRIGEKVTCNNRKNCIYIEILEKLTNKKRHSKKLTK